jgi:hypothetical protein
VRLIHQPIIKRSSPYFALYQAARVKIVAIVTQMRQGLSVLCRIRRRDERLAVVRRTSESFDRPSLLGHSSQPRGFGCILSVVGGVAFIGLALFLTLRHPEQTSIGTSSTNPSAQPPTPQRETFPEPIYGGFRLDACYESHTRCGEEPATAWCKMKGFGRAVERPEENVGTRGIHTKQIGLRLECSLPFCASFKYITCES